MSAHSTPLQQSQHAEAPASAHSLCDETGRASHPHPYLQQHPGFQRLFGPGGLTVGLILPLETHPGKPAPTMADHVEMAQRAEAETQVRIASGRTYLTRPDAVPPHTDHPDARLILWFCNRGDRLGSGANRLIDARAAIEALPHGAQRELSQYRLACPERGGLEPKGYHAMFELDSRNVFYARWLCEDMPCAAVRMFEQMIESRKYQRTVHLQVGEALLVDNRRMLHCR